MDQDALRKTWERCYGVDDLDSLDPGTTFDPGRAEATAPGTLPAFEVSLSDGIETLPGDEAPPATAVGAPRYTLEEVVGRGGMGIVYRAQQNALQRAIAVKRVHPLKADARLRAKFLAEARVTGLLDHPNIVPVYDLGLDADGEPLLAMKLVGGLDWKSLLAPRTDEARARAARLELLDHLRILCDVANAIAFAHTRGVLHLDLKPSNVMVGEFGEVLVMDWGIACAWGESQPHLPHCARIANPCGTPSYMAPELAAGDGSRIGPRTDVYLLGGMLYELLEGRPPHRGRTFFETLMAAARAKPCSYGPRTPAGLRAVCERALAKDPDDRFPDVPSFREAVQDWLRHHESNEIAERAERRLQACESRLLEVDPQRARPTPETSQALYADFAAAVVGFEQARLLWEENPLARAGEQRARRGYARAALACGDLVLARAQIAGLAADDPEAAPLQSAVADRERKRARARRSSRRLRWGLGALTAALVLVLAVGLSLVDGARATAERERAVANLQRAEADSLRAVAERNLRFADQREQVARSTLNGLIFSVDRRLRDLPGPASRALREELLESAFAGLDALRASDVAEDSLSLTAAGAFVQLGDLRQIQGHAAEALAHYRRALAIHAEARAGVGPAERSDHIIILNKVGRMAREVGDLALARRALEEGLERARAWWEADPEDDDAGAQVAAGLSLIAWLDAAAGDLARQEQRGLEAVAILRELCARRPAHDGIREQLADQLAALGRIALARGEPTQAIARFEEARTAYGEISRLSRGLQRDVRLLTVDLAQARGALGDASGATRAYEEVRDLLRAQLLSDPGDPDLRFDLAICLANLGQSRRLSADFAGALAELGEARDELARGAALYPGHPRWGSQQAAVERDIARVLIEQGALAEADETLRASIATLTGFAERFPEEVGYRESLSRAQLSLAEVSRLRGRPDEALALTRESVALRRALLERQPDHPEAQENLTKALSDLGHLELLHGNDSAARAAYEEQLALARALCEANPADPDRRQTLAISLGSIASLRRGSGDGEGARSAALESLELFRSIVALPGANVEDQRNVAVALGFLADDQETAGELEAARASLHDARALQAELLAAFPDSVGIRRSLANTIARLGQLHETLAQPTEALALYAESWEHINLLVEAGQTSSLQSLAFVAQRSGQILLEAGDRAAALACFEQAVEASAALAAVDPRFVVQHEQMAAWLEWLRREE